MHRFEEAFASHPDKKKDKKEHLLQNKINVCAVNIRQVPKDFATLFYSTPIMHIRARFHIIRSEITARDLCAHVTLYERERTNSA